MLPCVGALLRALACLSVGRGVYIKNKSVCFQYALERLRIILEKGTLDVITGRLPLTIDDQTASPALVEKLHGFERI